MWNISQNAVHVLIANYANDMPTSGTIKTYSDISNDGQIALVNGANTVISPASIVVAGNTYYDKEVRFVVRNGTELVFSPWFQGKDVANAASATGLADTQQVTYVGYNGSAYSLDAFDQNEYILNIEIKDEDVATGVYPYMKHAAYYSDTTATQAEVALGLVSSAIANFARESQSKIQFDAICNAAVTAANGTKTGQEVTVVKGSKVLTFETDVTYTAGGGSTLVVGDFVRIGTVGGGTALTSPVYKVTAISTVYVTLDRAVTNASGTYDDAGGTSDIEIIPAATGVAANWGIKMTGIARTNFVPGEQKHYLTTFLVTLARGFQSTVVTYTTKAAYGRGTYQKVAEDEYLAQGFSGKKVYVGVPQFKSRSAASAANLYDTVTFNIVKSGYKGLISSNPNNVTTVILYTNDDNASPNDELKTILGIS